jgi:hypothetical protein
MADRVRLRSWPGLAAVLLTIGCSRTPARVYPPKYDAKALGEQAIAKLDANGDHLLDAQELAASPALLADLKKLDKNGDQKLSVEEIGAKIDEWTVGNVGAVGAICWITRAGQPVANVQVKFIPESYLGDVVKLGSGVTDSQGGAEMTAEGQKSIGVMQCGYYRVELSQPQGGRETLPAKYNTNSILSADVRPNRRDPIAFDISQ